MVAEARVTDAQPTRLGVGLLYQKKLHRFLPDHLELIDYLEVVPDIAWTDHGAGASPRYVDDAESLAFLQEFRRIRPLVARSTGLSIGSAHRFRDEHVEQIRHWDQMLDFGWHSDHLAFNFVLDLSGEEYLLGVPFPVTFDTPTLELLAERIKRVRAAIPKPFLLENNVAYIDFGPQELDEPTFLNELCARSGCGLVLDLHNLYVNWRNGHVDIHRFLSSLDLTRVVEIHLAGGLVYEGTYLDAHSGGVPDDLWPIAHDTVPACSRLTGVTFELLGSWFPRLGEAALVETLERIRALSTRWLPQKLPSS